MSCTQIPDSARTKMESVYILVPSSLESRGEDAGDTSMLIALPLFFSYLHFADSLPYSVLDVEELPSLQYTPNPASKPSWIIPQSDLQMMENVGKGAIGDYYHAIWKGKEVVKKVLVNQKLDETDLMVLKAKVIFLLPSFSRNTDINVILQ